MIQIAGRANLVACQRSGKTSYQQVTMTFPREFLFLRLVLKKFLQRNMIFYITYMLVSCRDLGYRISLP